MAAPGHDPSFEDLQRRWRWLAGAFGTAGALTLAVGAVLAYGDGELATFGVGVLVGIAFVVITLGGQLLFFPNRLTRDLRRQEQRTAKVLPWAIGLGFVGAAALDFVPSFATAGAGGALFLCIGVWRTWWETSAYARRRWPATRG